MHISHLPVSQIICRHLHTCMYVQAVCLFPAVFFVLSPTVFVRVFGRHRIHMAVSYKTMAKTLAHIISMPLTGEKIHCTCTKPCFKYPDLQSEDLFVHSVFDRFDPGRTG